MSVTALGSNLSPFIISTPAVSNGQNSVMVELEDQAADTQGVMQMLAVNVKVGAALDIFA